MFNTERRILRFEEDIKKYINPVKYEIKDIQIRYGEIQKNINVNAITDGWQEYTPGSKWAALNEEVYALFKIKVTVPDEFNGKKLALKIKTNRTGWNVINPQMLLYLDGIEQQGLDTNHTEVSLSEAAQKGKVYDLRFYAFSGVKNCQFTSIYEEQTEVRLNIELVTIEPLIEDFYYNLLTPQQLLVQLPENSTDRIRLFGILNETINKVDFRATYSSDFYTSLEEANNYIKEQLYSKEHGLDAEVSCIGHTHIDVAWLWRYCHTREKAVRSFSTVLKLMEQYPEYIFMSSQPQLYEFIKEDYPQVYQKIKERVKEGRWEPEGGMWIEADTNVPSGESLVRQFLLGKRFFKEEFNIDNKILWLPDVFGYSGNLPQIMKKSGIDYFMTAKLAFNEVNKFPYQTFIWKGIDGSEVLSQLIDNRNTAYNGQVNAEEMVQGWNNYPEKDINDSILLTVGYGDGGGGTTKEMLESRRRYALGLPGSLKAKFRTAGAFFEKLDKKVRNNKKLPKWVGELYFEWHRGTYTSMARNKKYNRKAEFLYNSAEWAASFESLLLNADYPSDALNKGWKSILLNQFHDVLPGSSIKEVYEDTDKIYEEVFKTGNMVLENSLNRIVASINTEAEALVVFNPFSWERNGIVEFTYLSNKESIMLQASDGKVYSCQRIVSEANKYISSVEGVLSKGYTSFKIIKAESNLKNISHKLHISKELLENAFYKITLDEQGHFTSIFDKRASREVLKSGEKGNVIQAFEDKPVECYNWNIDIFYNEKMWEVNDVESMEVIEKGPERGILRIKRRFLKSSFIQDIIVYSDNARIDFKTHIDWKEEDIVLKAAFPLDIRADRATYEIQFGHIERDTHWNTSWDKAKFEVCGHKWADLSENGYGVSLLNDCKYGYDIKEGRMRLTLLRCGTSPNADADKEVHEFIYSLYPHEDGWREGRTVQEAYDLNYPLIGKVTGKQIGSLPGNMSMIRVDKENVIAETVKKAEDDSDMIIRVYEAYNRRSDVKLELINDIESACECDLMENDLDSFENKAKYEGKVLSFILKPFEIKTFKIKIKKGLS